MSGPQDVLLKCADCGGDFPWTGREQEFFRERDFPPPKRCKECRQANRQRFHGQPSGEGGAAGTTDTASSEYSNAKGE